MKGAMKPRPDRTLRVGGLIQEILAPLLQQYHKDHPNLPFVTITGVTVSRDLAYANVHVSILTNDRKVINHTIIQLNDEAKNFRFNLAKELRLRITPHVRFIFDESTMIGF